MDTDRRAILAAVGVLVAGGCLDRDDEDQQTSGTPAGDDGSRQSFATPTPDADMSDDASVSDPENPTATIATTHGDITVELFEQRAPRTVENFIGLATGANDYEGTDIEPGTGAWEDPETGEKRIDPLYDDVPFHRVIEDFMIQGGDPTGTGRGGPGYQFDDEFHDELSHDGPGILSMANSGPDTNGSQFFITLDAQPHLDGRHAVFGQVIDGMDVVEEIGSLPTGRNDDPQEDVSIESVDVDQ